MPGDAGADVVLFVDTFTRYFEPENADAALRVLRAAGCSVAVAAPDAADGTRPLCCGRTFLAHGLVDEARREAARMLDALSPHVARGATIVGLEPSCLLTLRDEFVALGLGERARTLASRAMLIEEFLVLESEAGRLDLPLDALAERRALVHGHCHQKAFDAAGAVVTALRWIPGLDVEAIESSCCGMAGSFGYGVDHYDVSMRMAELSLLPAVRTAAADTLIVADGTSCRHQIADGTRASGRARRRPRDPRACPGAAQRRGRRCANARRPDLAMTTPPHDATPDDALARISRATLEHYDRQAESFWQATRDHDVRQNIDALLTRIEGTPPFTVLDFGCGPGRDLRTFAELGHVATGLEGAAGVRRDGARVQRLRRAAAGLSARRASGAAASMASTPMRRCSTFRRRSCRACWRSCARR